MIRCFLYKYTKSLVNEVIVKCINMVGQKYTSRIGTVDNKPKNKKPLSTDYACTTRIFNELAYCRPYIFNLERSRIQISWRRGSFYPSQINHILQFTFFFLFKIKFCSLSFLSHTLFFLSLFFLNVFSILYWNFQQVYKENWKIIDRSQTEWPLVIEIN